MRTHVQARTRVRAHTHARTQYLHHPCSTHMLSVALILWYDDAWKLSGKTTIPELSSQSEEEVIGNDDDYRQIKPVSFPLSTFISYILFSYTAIHHPIKAVEQKHSGRKPRFRTNPTKSFWSISAFQLSRTLECLMMNTWLQRGFIEIANIQYCTSRSADTVLCLALDSSLLCFLLGCFFFFFCCSLTPRITVFILRFIGFIWFIVKSPMNSKLIQEQFRHGTYIFKTHCCDRFAL